MSELLTIHQVNRKLNDLIKEIEILKCKVGIEPPKPANLAPKVDEVITTIEQVYDLPNYIILGKSHRQPIPEARMIAMLLLFNMGLSRFEIGFIFSKDPGNVLNAKRVIEYRLGIYKDVKYRYDKIINLLNIN